VTLKKAKSKKDAFSRTTSFLIKHPCLKERFEEACDTNQQIDWDEERNRKCYDLLTGYKRYKNFPRLYLQSDHVNDFLIFISLLSDLEKALSKNLDVEISNRVFPKKEEIYRLSTKKYMGLKSELDAFYHFYIYLKYNLVGGDWKEKGNNSPDFLFQKDNNLLSVECKSIDYIRSDFPKNLNRDAEKITTYLRGNNTDKYVIIDIGKDKASKFEYDYVINQRNTGNYSYTISEEIKEEWGYTHYLNRQHNLLLKRKTDHSNIKMAISNFIDKKHSKKATPILFITLHGMQKNNIELVARKVERIITEQVESINFSPCICMMSNGTYDYNINRKLNVPPHTQMLSMTIPRDNSRLNTIKEDILVDTEEFSKKASQATLVSDMALLTK
jgi:hypothetical protein